MAATKMNWDKRISWGSPGTRKTSSFYNETVVKRCGVVSAAFRTAPAAGGRLRRRGQALR